MAAPYFTETDRSLNSPVQGPFDGFSYHTSIFPYFIDLQYGADVLRIAFENIAAGDDTIAGLDAALMDTGSSIGEAFAHFSFWNIFTGDRATDGGYPQSATFAKVPVTSLDVSKGANWDVDTEPFTAKWGLLTLDGSMRISTEAIDGFSQQAVVFAGTSPDDAVLLTEEGVVFDDAQVYVAIGNGFESGDAAVRIKVRADDGASNNANNENNVNNANNDNNTNNVTVDPEPEDEGCATASGSPSVWFILLALFGFNRRSNRSRRVRN